MESLRKWPELFRSTSYFCSSDAKDLDVSISYSTIQKVVAKQRSIIPAIEVSLVDKQEHFTNFYNLGGVVSVLRRILPEGVVLEMKESGESGC